MKELALNRLWCDNTWEIPVLYGDGRNTKALNTIAPTGSLWKV